ncbi:restriction endonuclease subunit S [Streptomyces sp. NPDC051132]|uniref:restriction endonuclease subunit S n=1 Tax=unclassified Streptomyces TaxID=2593676 RepID=UPI00341DB9D4
MSSTDALLGDIIKPATLRRAGTEELPILSMTMRDGLVDQADKFKKRVASADTSAYRVVDRGQLVVGFPIDEGVLSFQRLYDSAIVSPAYDIWELVDPNLVSRGYLEYYLRSPRALRYYRAKLQGSTARRRSLPRDIFLALPVPMPPLGEQKRIAAVLDQVDTLRAKRREAISLLGNLAQSVFLNMFGDPARNPLGWPVGKVGDLLISANYGSSAKADAEGDVPVLRMNNITTSGDLDMRDLKYLSSEQVSEKHLVRAGDVLFNRTNSAELVGKSAIYRLPEEVAYAGYLVRLRVSEENHPEYLAAFLNSQYAKRVLRSMSKSIVGMANINAKEVQSIKIPIPPLAEQKRFASAITQVEAAKEPHRTHLATLDELFTSLQHRAFSGALWDHEAAGEAA